MRKRDFNVSVDSVYEFSQILDDNNLSNQIIGTDDEDVVIQVIYDTDEKQAIYELIELLDSEDVDDEDDD